MSRSSTVRSSGCERSFKKEIGTEQLHRETGSLPDLARVLQGLYDGRLSDRNRSMVILANHHGLSREVICSFLGICKLTYLN